jgi:hypothetical protein
MEGADRRKQASGTRAPTEPKDVDPTSSQSNAKRDAQHSKNDASKENTTSIDAAVIQPGKPGLGFHPGLMDRAESGPFMMCYIIKTGDLTSPGRV